MNDEVISVVTDFSIMLAKWPEQAELLRKLRESVFVIEQGVDAAIEWDGKDNLCQHLIAFSADNQPIATGRMLPDGHIGRIAVIPSWRGKGVGAAILENLIALARNADAEMVYLNSQTHALAFYQRFSFIAEGEVYMEAGIPHQRMTLKF